MSAARPLRIGTRASALALWQASRVAELIRAQPGAPIVELVAAVLQMQRGKIHRTINIDELDANVTLDVTAKENREVEIRYLMKSSFGFGGINCVSILKAPASGEGR